MIRIPRYLPRVIGIIMLGVPILFGYQNCSKKTHFSAIPQSLEVQPLAIPEVLVTLAPAKLERNPQADIEFVINPDHPHAVDSFECFLNEEEIEGCQSPLQIDGLSDGDYIFKVRVIDVQGSQSDFEQVLFAIDQTPPVIVINSRPMDISSATQASYSFSVSDNFIGVSSVICRLNSGTDEECSDSYVVSDLSDGAYTFTIKATDRAGNYVEAVDKFIVDSTAPQIQITSHPDEFTKLRQASFSFIGSDENGILGYQCSLDGQSYQDCTSPFLNTNSLADGGHIFSVRAIDSGGIESSPVSYSWVIDNVTPTNIVNSTIMPYPRFLLERSDANVITLNFSSTDAGSGIGRYAYTINSGSEVPCEVPCDINITQEGVYRFKLIAYDRAGNKNELNYSNGLVAKFVTDSTPSVTLSSVRTSISPHAKPHQILQKDGDYLVTGGAILNITDRANPTFVNLQKSYRYFTVQSHLFFGLENSTTTQLSIINLEDPSSPKVISSSASIVLSGATQVIQSLSSDISSLYVCYSVSVPNPSGITSFDAVVSAFDVSDPASPVLRYHRTLESGLVATPSCYGNKSKLVVAIPGANRKIKFYEASVSGVSNLNESQVGVRTDGIVMSNDRLFVNSNASALRDVYSLTDLNVTPLQSLGRTYGFTNGHSTGELATGSYVYAYRNRNYKFVDVSDLTQKEFEFATNFKSNIVVREPQEFRDDTLESIVVDDYLYTFSFTDPTGLGTVRVYGLSSRVEPSARYIWDCRCSDGSAGFDVNCYDTIESKVVDGSFCKDSKKDPEMKCIAKACVNEI